MRTRDSSAQAAPLAKAAAAPSAARPAPLAAGVARSAAGVLTLQRTCGNRTTAALLQRTAPAAGSRTTTAPPAPGAVQRLLLKKHEGYGAGVSIPAFERRLGEGIEPYLNVATFHLVNRETGQTRTLTERSTGVRESYPAYPAGGRRDRMVHTNWSHSEHLIYEQLMAEAREPGPFPAREVIDWVYTERAPCMRSNEARGCLDDLQALEDRQGSQITVFYTFDDRESDAGNIDAAVGAAREYLYVRRRIAAELFEILESIGDPDPGRRAERGLGSWADWVEAGYPRAHKAYHDILSARAQRAAYMARLRRDTVAEVEALYEQGHRADDAERTVPDWSDFILDEPEYIERLSRVRAHALHTADAYHDRPRRRRRYR